MYLQLNNFSFIKSFTSKPMGPFSAKRQGCSSLRSRVFLDVTLFKSNRDEHSCVFLQKKKVCRSLGSHQELP